MSLHNKSERWSLYTSDRKHLPGARVLQRIQSCGIHTEYPVADGSRQTGVIKVVEIRGWPELFETFAD